MADQDSPFDGGRFHYVKLGGPDPDGRDGDPADTVLQPEPGAADLESQSVPPPGQSAIPGPSSGQRGRGATRTRDRLLGIVLGLVLGVGIVTAFVFLGSEETIDAPRVQNEARNQQKAPGH